EILGGAVGEIRCASGDTAQRLHDERPHIGATTGDQGATRIVRQYFAPEVRMRKRILVAGDLEQRELRHLGCPRLVVHADVEHAGRRIGAHQLQAVTDRAVALVGIAHTDRIEMRRVANPDRTLEKQVVAADDRLAEFTLLVALIGPTRLPTAEVAEHRSRPAAPARVRPTLHERQRSKRSGAAALVESPGTIVEALGNVKLVLEAFDLVQLLGSRRLLAL